MALSVGQTQLVDLGALGVSGYPFTLAGWFRVQNLSQLMTLMGIGNSVSGSYHRLIHLGSTTKAAGAISNTGSSSLASSTAVMVPGQWHHVTGVFEATNSRRVYLDGGNSGANSGSRVWDTANLHYLGNNSTTTTVDVAEAAVFNVVLSSIEISMLAEGLSLLCLPAANHLLAYQSCIRRLNWPARGPHAVAAAMPNVIAHPRIFCALSGATQVVPNRVPGPYTVPRRSLQTASARTGLTHIAGVLASYGQMSIAGSAAAQLGLEET